MRYYWSAPAFVCLQSNFMLHSTSTCGLFISKQITRSSHSSNNHILPFSTYLLLHCIQKLCALFYSTLSSLERLWMLFGKQRFDVADESSSFTPLILTNLIFDLTNHIKTDHNKATGTTCLLQWKAVQSRLHCLRNMTKSKKGRTTLLKGRGD